MLAVVPPYTETLLVVRFSVGQLLIDYHKKCTTLDAINDYKISKYKYVNMLVLGSALAEV